MVSEHPVKFDGYRYFGSGDTMFLVVEELDPTCSCLNPPLSPIHIAWKHTPCHINKSDLGHTHLKKKMKKRFK